MAKQLVYENQHYIGRAYTVTSAAEQAKKGT